MSTMQKHNLFVSYWILMFILHTKVGYAGFVPEKNIPKAFSNIEADKNFAKRQEEQTFVKTKLVTGEW